MWSAKAENNDDEDDDDDDDDDGDGDDNVNHFSATEYVLLTLMSSESCTNERFLAKQTNETTTTTQHTTIQFEKSVRRHKKSYIKQDLIQRSTSALETLSCTSRDVPRAVNWGGSAGSRGGGGGRRVTQRKHRVCFH